MSSKPEIRLSYEDRMKLMTEGKCPNCQNKEFIMANIEKEKHKNHLFKAFRKGRPVYICQNCRYWTDWFDGWNWHPPISEIQKLIKEIKEIKKE